MKPKFKFHPLYWPFLFLLSPFLIPYLIIKNIRFKQNRKLAKQYNDERISIAENSSINIPKVKKISMTVVVEEKTEDGFIGDAGISYLFKTEKGSLLYDVGFGDERPAFNKNWKSLKLDAHTIDSFLISHLHPDHMGGFKASKQKKLSLPVILQDNSKKPCFVPDYCTSDDLLVEQLSKPFIFKNNLVSTGPLARGLFLMGLTEEQALIACIEGKGLLIVSGCGHPGIETILQMVHAITDEPVYAIAGGFHFPITESRGAVAGLQMQRILGTGKSIFERLTTKDLDSAIDAINAAKPQHVLLSAHDSCDYSIQRMQDKINCNVEILKAGGVYEF